MQNRVAIAEAKLPEEVKRQGVTTKKKSPSILLCVNLISPDDEPRTTSSTSATSPRIQVKDALARIEGVGDVSFLGPRDYSMRVWLDPEKLAVARHDRRRRGQRAPRAERAGRRRPPRPAADARTGSDFQLHRQHPRPPARAESSSTTSSSRPATAGRLARRRASRRRRADGVELGAKNYDVNSYLDGKPSVTLAVFQLPGSNALATADGHPGRRWRS